MESSMESVSTAFDQGSPSTSQAGDAPTGLTFIKHQVTKMDTLAGLAIKYNVSVGDIKRANGLLSDSAVYGRGTILIPSGHLPIGEELQRICAQVLAGVNRDPVLHAEQAQHPASSALGRIATTLNVVNGQSYPADMPLSEAAFYAMCQCGGCGPMDPNGLCNRNLQPIELELTDRSSEGTYFPPASAGPTRQHDAAVRLRRNGRGGPGGDDDDNDSGHSGWGWAQRPTPYAGGPRMGGGVGGDTGSDNGQRLATWFSELGKAIGEGVSQTVAKVKEAANQPVLARTSGNGSGMGGFGAAADAVLSSARGRKGSASTLLGRAPFEGGAGSSVAGGSGAYVKTKHGGKAD